MFDFDLKVPISEHDHVRGADHAPVTLVEYGDYECPYCQDAFYAVREAQEILGDQMRYVFRNFPLSEIHPDAELAAEAAEAAGAQGRFWEMHDSLFEHQDSLDSDSLVDRAEGLGLDVDRFVADLGEGAFVKRVAQDLQGGERSGVDSTPSFFINGIRYRGATNAEELIEAMRAEIERLEKRLAS